LIEGCGKREKEGSDGKIQRSRTDECFNLKFIHSNFQLSIILIVFRCTGVCGNVACTDNDHYLRFSPTQSLQVFSASKRCRNSTSVLNRSLEKEDVSVAFVSFGADVVFGVAVKPMQ
jgi:hypothetical protein